MEGKYKNIHQDLINDCQKGDQKAQFEIYKLYYKPLFNTAFRMLNDFAGAEDVMQEAFFSAFEKLHTYNGEVSFGAWLKKIVINKSLDALKKRKIEFSGVDKTVRQLAAENDNEDFFEETFEEIERIKKSIQELPEGYRVILSLILFEGFDHEEVSEILGITQSTSRSQFTRAKQKLIEILRKKAVA